MAVILIKEQTKMMQKIAELRKYCDSLEKTLCEEKDRADRVLKSIEDESMRYMHTEAAYENSSASSTLNENSWKLAWPKLKRSIAICLRSWIG